MLCESFNLMDLYSYIKTKGTYTFRSSFFDNITDIYLFELDLYIREKEILPMETFEMNLGLLDIYKFKTYRQYLIARLSEIERHIVLNIIYMSIVENEPEFTKRLVFDYNSFITYFPLYCLYFCLVSAQEKSMQLVLFFSSIQSWDIPGQLFAETGMVSYRYNSDLYKITRIPFADMLALDNFSSGNDMYTKMIIKNKNAYMLGYIIIHNTLNLIPVLDMLLEHDISTETALMFLTRINREKYAADVLKTVNIDAAVNEHGNIDVNISVSKYYIIMYFTGKNADRVLLERVYLSKPFLKFTDDRVYPFVHKVFKYFDSAPFQ